MRSIEKTNSSEIWQFFENLRNMANSLIFKFHNQQNFKIWTISKIIKFSYSSFLNKFTIFTKFIDWKNFGNSKKLER